MPMPIMKWPTTNALRRQPLFIVILTALLLINVCGRISVQAKIPQSIISSHKQSSLQKLNNDGVSSSRSVGRGLAHIPSFLEKRIPTTTSTTKKARALQKDIDIEWSIATGQILSVRGGDSSTSDSDSEDEYDVEYDDDSDEDEYDEYDTDSDEEYDLSDTEDDDGVVSSIKSTSLKTSIKSKSHKDDIIDYDDMLQPPAMQQMIITVGVMLLSNKIDILNVKAVRIARYAFVSYLVVTQLFLGYVYLRVKSMNDRTSITISNPLAGLVNGAGGARSGGSTNFMVKAITNQVLSTTTTIFEYDIKQVKKMNGSLLFPMIMLYFLHFRMKQVQPLLMQTCTGVMNLVYSPLFQVYVLGRKLERPFKPPTNPMMEAMQKQQEELQKAQQGEEGVEEEAGEVDSGEEVDESGEESEDEEEEESDDEEEYDSDDE